MPKFIEKHFLKWIHRIKGILGHVTNKKYQKEFDFLFSKPKSINIENMKNIKERERKSEYYIVVAKPKYKKVYFI